LLSEKLEKKEWIEVFEFNPPSSVDAENLTSNLKYESGTIIAVTDNPDAEPRMNAIAASVHLQKKGYSIIMVMNCRDYNRIALQSMILGMNSLGINSVLLRTGIHQTKGKMKDAKIVFDLDPVQLLQIINQMRKNNVFSNNQQFEGTCAMTVAIQEHPLTGDPSLKPYIFKKKLQLGADLIVTDPITDFEKLNDWIQSIESIEGYEKLPVLLGLPAGSSEVPEFVRKSSVFCGVYHYG